MPIEFTCPECGGQYRAPDHRAGHRIACKQCGHMMRVPGDPPAASGQGPTGTTPSNPDPVSASAAEEENEGSVLEEMLALDSSQSGPKEAQDALGPDPGWGDGSGLSRSGMGRLRQGLAEAFGRGGTMPTDQGPAQMIIQRGRHRYLSGVGLLLVAAAVVWWVAWPRMVGPRAIPPTLPADASPREATLATLATQGVGRNAHIEIEHYQIDPDLVVGLSETGGPPWGATWVVLLRPKATAVRAPVVLVSRRLPNPEAVEALARQDRVDGTLMHPDADPPAAVREALGERYEDLNLEHALILQHGETPFLYAGAPWLRGPLSWVGTFLLLPGLVLLGMGAWGVPHHLVRLRRRKRGLLVAAGMAAAILLGLTWLGTVAGDGMGWGYLVVAGGVLLAGVMAVLVGWLGSFEHLWRESPPRALLSVVVPGYHAWAVSRQWDQQRESVGMLTAGAAVALAGLGMMVLGLADRTHQAWSSGRGLAAVVGMSPAWTGRIGSEASFTSDPRQGGGTTRDGNQGIGLARRPQEGRPSEGMPGNGGTEPSPRSPAGRRQGEDGEAVSRGPSRPGERARVDEREGSQPPIAGNPGSPGSEEAPHVEATVHEGGGGDGTAIPQPPPERTLPLWQPMLGLSGERGQKLNVGGYTVRLPRQWKMVVPRRSARSARATWHSLSGRGDGEGERPVIHFRFEPLERTSTRGWPLLVARAGGGPTGGNRQAVAVGRGRVRFGRVGQAKFVRVSRPAEGTLVYAGYLENGWVRALLDYEPEDSEQAAVERAFDQAMRTLRPTTSKERARMGVLVPEPPTWRELQQQGPWRPAPEAAENLDKLAVLGRYALSLPGGASLHRQDRDRATINWGRVTMTVEAVPSPGGGRAWPIVAESGKTSDPGRGRARFRVHGQHVSYGLIHGLRFVRIGPPAWDTSTDGQIRYGCYDGSRYIQVDISWTGPPDERVALADAAVRTFHRSTPDERKRMDWQGG